MLILIGIVFFSQFAFHLCSFVNISHGKMQVTYKRCLTPRSLLANCLELVSQRCVQYCSVWFNIFHMKVCRSCGPSAIVSKEWGEGCNQLFNIGHVHPMKGLVTCLS